MKHIKSRLAAIDWPLLLLLTVVANQAVLWLKFAGLLLVFVLRPQLRGLFKKDRLSLFYPLVILLGALNYLLLVRDYTLPAFLASAVGLSFIAAAYLGAHQVKLSVEKNPGKITGTLKLFVLLNALFSLAQVAQVAWKNGVWNPYLDLPFPYGMSTGDLVMGVFGEASYNNAFVSGLLVLFFLFRRQWLYVALCLFTELLVFGNVMLLSLAFVLLLLAGGALAGSRLRRWKGRPGSQTGIAAFAAAIIMLGMVVVVSPANLQYIKALTLEQETERYQAVNTYEAEKTADQQQAQPLSYLVSRLDFHKYSRPDCVSDTQDVAARRAMTQYAVAALKGKKLSFLETKAYLNSGVGPFLLGAGPSRFSSLTAARFSGLDSSRLFTKVLPSFATCAYSENHRLIHITRVSGDDAWLSNANWPDSFFNQLAGEYGLLGILLFLIFYVWRYLRHAGRLQYGLWISALMIPIALLTYLIEPLCVLFFYELLMEKDLADHPPTLAT